MVNRLFAPEIKKPNLAAVQTAFTGRLYAQDMFTLYRAVSGRYPTYASIVGGAIGLAVQQDIVGFLGAFGPFGRFHYVGDVYSAMYNRQVQRDLEPLGLLSAGFWTGWERYTQLLDEDAEEVGEPWQLGPDAHFTLPTTELDPHRLSAEEQALYAIYRGDVDSMEWLLRMMTVYMPETLVALPWFKQDLEGIFDLYGQWAAERFLERPAPRGARVMAKSILLADYRWYLLAGDLLSMIEPVFLEAGFDDGILALATLMRRAAELISIE